MDAGVHRGRVRGSTVKERGETKDGGRERMSCDEFRRAYETWQQTTFKAKYFAVFTEPRSLAFIWERVKAFYRSELVVPKEKKTCRFWIALLIEAIGLCTNVSIYYRNGVVKSLKEVYNALEYHKYPRLIFTSLEVLLARHKQLTDFCFKGSFVNRPFATRVFFKYFPLKVPPPSPFSFFPDEDRFDNPLPELFDGGWRCPNPQERWLYFLL
jgi:hypothetical protein